MRIAVIGAAIAVAAVFGASTAPALAAGPKLKLEPLVTGVNTPLAMVQAPGDNRMFVVEQWGRVRIVENGKLLPTPFLDIRSKIVKLHADFDERGLLGIALHPKFKENGKLYVAYSAHLEYGQSLEQMFWWDHSNVIEEYTVSSVDPNAVDPSSARRILSTPWPQFNHNGHWIGFGPDGKLYISTGDGGYANDWGIGHNVTEGNGQDMTSMHGKVLRIDVDARSPGKAYGVPPDNPFVGNRNAKPESGRSACATRGAVPSIPARATCFAPTCSRTVTRKSTSSPRGELWLAQDGG
jgi:glucose/arabinose dehydrogenase